MKNSFFILIIIGLIMGSAHYSLAADVDPLSCEGRARVLKEAEADDYIAMGLALIYSGMCLKGHQEEYKWRERLAKLGIAGDELGYANLLDKIGKPDEAVVYYRRSIAKGEGTAAYQLAMGCQQGRLKCEELKIQDLLELAVRTGNINAVEPLAELLSQAPKIPLYQEKAAGWLLYSNRHRQCRLLPSEKFLLSQLRSKLSKKQWQVAVELSHINGHEVIDNVPSDGMPCEEEEGFSGKF